MRYRAQSSGAVLTDFVTWPQPSSRVDVPGKRNRDHTHTHTDCASPGGVIEGGRENCLWTAVCHVQMYGGCYCHNKIQSGQSPPDSSVVIEFGPYPGDTKELCPLNSVRDRDQEASKRKSSRDSN